MAAEQENVKLNGMVEYLKKELKNKRRDFDLLKREVSALMVERKNFNISLDREVEKKN